jgi:hypothetical protein
MLYPIQQTGKRALYLPASGWQRAGMQVPLQGSDFYSGKDEAEVLKDQAKYFEEELKRINERIASLEKSR